jgi:long-chain acyl-CoA synthetase
MAVAVLDPDGLRRQRPLDMAISVLETLREHAVRRPDAVAYGEKIAGVWRTTTWQDYDRQIRRCARALLALGVREQERIAILGGNRPEWAIFCLAAMSIRAVAVGVYQTCSPEQVAFIVDHAEAPLILVEDEAQWRKLDLQRESLPRLRQVVMMRAAGALPDDPRVLGWEAFLALADQVPPERLEEIFATIQGDDTATFIYTSGTTGHPKAVMISHRNILETGRIGNRLQGLRADDSIVSYLPLAHVAEQMMSIHMPAFVGFSVYWVEAAEKLPENLLEVQPTIFFAVPRVWERYFAAVHDKLQAAPAWRRGVGRWAMRVGHAYSEALNHGRRPERGLALRYAVADRLVLAKVRDRLGLRHLRVAASGAAPITREVLDFFAGLGVQIYEVYGLSETCGPGTWNRAGMTRLGTVGPVMPEVELRIDADGEILFRGPNVFQGYYKDEVATREAIDAEGWLHTGDIGSLDADGCLCITGRKKELIITSGGKNVAPLPIENALKEIELVGDAVVIGEGRRFITALLSLEEEAASRFARKLGLEAGVSLQPKLIEELRKAIEAVNKRLARAESVRDFRLLPDRLSPERGELTPTLKVKRQTVATRYADLIEDMYR